jgi:hypothetical protein
LRMFLADEDTSTLLEWREVQINPPADDPTPPTQNTQA